MRTARALTIGGGGVPAQGVYLPGGGVPAQGALPARRGVYLPGGVCTCPGGVPAWRVYLPRCPSPVNRMTDRCKNITLPQTSFAGGNKEITKTVIKCGVVTT